MVTATAKLINRTGLHARPASDFVAAAKSFSSKILIKAEQSPKPPVNAKSIIMLLSLGLAQNTVVELSAEGEDEKEAIEKLKELIESGFGETA